MLEKKLPNMTHVERQPDFNVCGLQTIPISNIITAACVAIPDTTAVVAGARAITTAMVSTLEQGQCKQMIKIAAEMAS